MSQILELLGQPQNPKDVEQWYDVCLAIAEECTPEFLALCKNKDITNNGCVSHEMNLFSVEVCRCISSKNNNIIEGSTLDKMIKANMIKAIYQMPELNIDSEYNEDTKSVEFTNDFYNSPYYIYCQSYWTSDPQQRMNIPANPVKITQIDEKYHKRLLHVPVRFNNAEDMQIAQWFVCDTEGPKLLIDNAGYSLLPIDSNTKKYCLTRPFLLISIDIVRIANIIAVKNVTMGVQTPPGLSTHLHRQSFMLLLQQEKMMLYIDLACLKKSKIKLRSSVIFPNSHTGTTDIGWISTWRINS